MSCHTDRCPTGVTTQDPSRNRALSVPLKTDRVYNYHHATLHALAELIAAAGLDHPQDIRPIHFSQRVASNEVKSFAQLYPSLRPGELIDGTEDARFKEAWAMARAESFSPAAKSSSPRRRGPITPDLAGCRRHLPQCANETTRRMGPRLRAGRRNQNSPCNRPEKTDTGPRSAL